MTKYIEVDSESEDEEDEEDEKDDEYCWDCGGHLLLCICDMELFCYPEEE